MHGASNVNLPAPVTRQIGWPHNAGRDAGTKEFAIPYAMIFVSYCAGILSGQYPSNTFLNSLVGLPVSSGRESIATLAVVLMEFRVPCPASHAIDKLGTDTISFDGQRVICIESIHVRDFLEIALYIFRHVRRFRKSLEDRLPHRLPHQANAIDIGGPLTR